MNQLADVTKFRMLFALLCGLAISTADAAPTDCPQMYVHGEAPEIVNAAIQRNTHELCFTAYGIMHSGLSRTALWSAEHLTRESLSAARKQKRENDFHEETALPITERSNLADYVHSGDDRGHLTPSADAPSKQAQFETFSLSNMVPQNAALNRGLWAEIETSVRKLVVDSGELYIITGPLFLSDHIDRLHNRVMVPSNLFKLVYDPQRNEAGAYLVQNRDSEDYKVISVDELEKISGIDFLPGMDAAAKQRVLPLPIPKPHGSGSHSESAPTFASKPFLNLLHLLR